MDLSQLLSSISPQDMEKLKAAAAGIISSGAQSGENAAVQSSAPQNTGTPAPASVEPSQTSAVAPASAPMPDAGLLSSVAGVAKLMNTDDDRIRFIEALKPLLSENKRRKADEAEKMLRLLTVLPALKDSGLLNGLI